MTYSDNPSREVFNIDFDGTLTDTTNGIDYSNDPPPERFMIDKTRELYYSGHIIIIWTARQWVDAPMLVSWLIKHDVPFHGIYMSKGGADHYVDDKNMDLTTFKAL